MVPIFLLVAIGHLSYSADTPAKMTHLIAQMDGTGIAEGSFAAKPKTFWRASNKYCRIDEEPDPENGIHGRMIINEPDAWMVNLADKSAQHIVDPGPTFNCKLPIFALGEKMAKSKIGELEFGHEAEFFRANGAKPIDGPKLSYKTNAYELEIEDFKLVLVERAENHIPAMIGLLQGDKAYKVTYQLWEDQVPFDPEIFAKPVGVSVTERK